MRSPWFRAGPTLLLAILLVAPLGRAEDAGSARNPEDASRLERDDARQVELIRGAERAEREARPRDALALYREAAALAPGSRLARRARTRIDWLEARGGKSDGPLIELLRMQRLGPGELTAARLEAFEGKLAGFPPGPVRRAARALVAEAWLNRLDRPARAIPAFERWLEEPGVETAEWELATTELALARARLGNISGSVADLRAAGLGKRAETAFLELELLGRYGRPAALLLIVAFLAAALGSGWRGLGAGALARGLSPPRLALAGWLFAVPLAAARVHRPETWRAMLFIVPASAALLLVASVTGMALGDRARPSRRRLLTALGIAAQLAAVYLALDHTQVLLAILVNYRLH